MKKLLITRHAKTIRPFGDMDDFDRYLAPRGPKDIDLVAHEIMRVGEMPECIVTSPAKRALQTAEMMADYFDQVPVETADFLYGYYTFKELLKHFGSRFPDTDFIMVVGHNPTLAEVGDQLTQAFYEHLPTTGTLIIEFHFDRWEEIIRGSGHLAHFIIPGRLR